MSDFFSIVPRVGSFLNSNNQSIPLKIIRGKGIDVTPGFGINVTELNNGYKQFTRTSERGDSFNVQVIFERDDTYIVQVEGKQLTKLEYMDYIVRNAVPVMVQTEALNVENGDYLITKNPSRVQNYKDDTVWELTFTTYVPLTLIKFANDNSAVLNAIKKAKAKKASGKKSSKSTKNSSVKYQKLKNCGYKTLVYSKNKKVVACVKVLQEVLYKNNCLSKKDIDGWFGKTTKEAVKKYQKQYNKRHEKVIPVVDGQVIPTGKNLLSKWLDVTGKVDKATWTALYKGE